MRRETPFFMSIEGDGLTLFIRGRIDLLMDDGQRLMVSDYKYARAGAGITRCRWNVTRSPRPRPCLAAR